MSEGGRGKSGAEGEMWREKRYRYTRNGNINFLTFFFFFKERVIIYTMYNGSQLRSKIIAITRWLRLLLKGLWTKGAGTWVWCVCCEESVGVLDGDDSGELDESEYKRFLSYRASRFVKNVYILQLDNV